ncbi:MAG: hypothetical protein JHC33_12590 [Ignisphaera sp.]|nr:hypothetical protein [Ignisphaera sp.]
MKGIRIVLLITIALLVVASTAIALMTRSSNSSASSSISWSFVCVYEDPPIRGVYYKLAVADTLEKRVVGMQGFDEDQILLCNPCGVIFLGLPPKAWFHNPLNYTIVLYIADIQSNRIYLNRSIVMRPGDVVLVELDKYQVVIEFHERTKPLTNTLIIDPCTCRCS